MKKTRTTVSDRQIADETIADLEGKQEKGRASSYGKRRRSPGQPNGDTAVDSMAVSNPCWERIAREPEKLGGNNFSREARSRESIASPIRAAIR
jgi:hypothetical protein